MLEAASRFLELVAFKALADLRSERQRTYLGFLWWLFEPAFFLLVFYLVFDVLLKRGGANFVPTLLCGVVLWQWFSSAVLHSTTAIKNAVPLSRSVKVPMAVFPLANVLADTVKFAFVVVILLVILTFLGHPPNFGYFVLPVVLVVEFVFICGVCFIVSALVPLVPDLRYAILPILQGGLFLSAVFFDFRSVSPQMQKWLAFNPMATLIDSGRELLLYGVYPRAYTLMMIFGISVLLLLFGIVLIHKLSPMYPKLAD